MTDYGLLTEVSALPRSTTLESDAAIGDTQLVVDYAGDFNSEDGGTLDLNGARLAYTGITDGDQPDDPDTILLAAALTVGATANDTVSVVAGGQVLVDYVAHVVMGIGDEVHVPLSVYQVPMWPVGTFDDPIPVEVSDDLLHLEDAPGRTATATPDPAAMSRITVYRHVYLTDHPEITDGHTGVFNLLEWTGTDDPQVGNDITLNSPDDGNININNPGIYAFSVWLHASGIEGARQSMDLRAKVLIASPFFTVFDCNTRGGDAGGSVQAQPSSSRTYFHPGASNDIYLQIAYKDWDTANVADFIVELSIQRVI